MTLMQAQDEAVAALLYARGNGKRSASYGLTFLNRSPRVLQGVRTRYFKAARKMGFTDDQVEAQYRDVKDMAELLAMAD